jgi:prepilin-type N-terminal cleavage/methylation domain-containing protein
MGRVTTRKQAGGEGGFTLTELLVAITILGIISGALAIAFVVSGHSSAETTQRFKESHDAQIASAYLATDVQSAKQITGATCGAPGGLTPLLNFSYDGASSIASYLYGSDGTEQQLRRRFCDAGGGVVTDVALVHFGGASPTASCDGGACNPGTTPKPNKVKITVNEHNSVKGSDDYSYSLTGVRRSYAGAGDPPAPGGLPHLLALGGSGLELAIVGNGSLTVNGDVIVNSTSQPAVTRTGNGTFGYGTLEIVSPGTCSGCASTPTSRANPVPDPFAGLPIPNESGQPVFTDGNPSHGPGVYRGTPLSFPNGVTTLASGVYIVESGFSFAGQAVVDGSAGVLFFNGCGANAPAGCANTGAFSLTGQVAMTLNPLPGTSAYAQAKLVLWQPKANTSVVTIAGQGAATSLNGVLYAPGSSEIDLSSGNGGLTIGYVVGSTIAVSGNGAVTIG